MKKKIPENMMRPARPLQTDTATRVCCDDMGAASVAAGKRVRRRMNSAKGWPRDSIVIVETVKRVYRMRILMKDED